MRPNPRALSQRVLTSNASPPTSKSALLIIFTQFIMHDITRLTLSNVCNCGSAGGQCANIQPDFGDLR